MRELIAVMMRLACVACLGQTCAPAGEDGLRVRHTLGGARPPCDRLRGGTQPEGELGKSRGRAAPPRPPPLAERPNSWQETHDLSVYETMLKSSPRDADVWSAYGHALMTGHNDPTRAMQAYGRAIELLPSHSYALNNLGYILLRYRNDVTMAESCYRKAIAAAPSDANANVNLAVLLSHHREPPDFETAAECYERALTVDDKHIGALVNFANFLVERPLSSLDARAAAAARACAQEASEQRPRAQEASPRDGVDADRECAEGSFTAEELVRPRTAAEQEAAQSTLAHMIGKLRDWRDAALLYDRALEVKPDSADAMCGYAALKRHEDDLPAAEALYTAAIAADPNHYASRSQYGLMLHKQNHLGGAREQYERALAINPDDAVTRYLGC